MSTGRVVAVTDYTVTARRWAHGWELHIEGVGVTQSRSLATAERMARDYLAMDLGGDPDEYTVTIRPELDGNLATEAETAREAVRRAEQAQQQAAAQSRDVAKRLKESGLSGRDIAAVMMLSTQRVSQLVNSSGPKQRTSPRLTKTVKKSAVQGRFEPRQRRGFPVR
jgi:hypothetical protein